MHRCSSIVTFACAFVALFASSANAAVTFNVINAGLFGASAAGGNAIAFTPIGFATTANGGASNFVDSTLVMEVESTGGDFIDKILLEESGDFTLSGNGGAATSASVAANLTVTVLEVDGSPIVPLVLGPEVLTFTPSDTFTFPTLSGVWEGEETIDVSAGLASNAIVGLATKVEVQLYNRLDATSEAIPNTTAFIAKKTTDGTTITVIPEPASLGLLGAGLLALRRRRA